MKIIPFETTLQWLKPQHTFSNIGHKLNSNFSSHTSSHPTPEATSHVLSKIPPINIQFVLYFKDIGANKATGTDGLSVKILRLAIPLLSTYSAI